MKSKERKELEDRALKIIQDTSCPLASYASVQKAFSLFKELIDKKDLGTFRVYDDENNEEDFIKESIKKYEEIIGNKFAIIRFIEILQGNDYSLSHKPTDIPEIKFQSTPKPKITWSAEEDQLLVDGVSRCGEFDWENVSKLMGGGKSRSECYNRWYLELSPKISKEPFTDEEDALLVKLVGNFGTNCWRHLSDSFKNRNNVQLQYRYKQIAKLEKKNYKTNELKGIKSLSSNLNDDRNNSNNNINNINNNESNDNDDNNEKNENNENYENSSSKNNSDN